MWLGVQNKTNGFETIGSTTKLEAEEEVKNMDFDKSFVFQKQIRENADTLQNEFLAMKHWEQQMKEAEKGLQCSEADQTQMLPPIRRKKISSRSKSKSKDNNSKYKRIKSYDYSGWDHFDVDKASEEIEKENESEDSGEELLTREELQERHKEATKHKVMGNNYVKKQKWEAATACYSEAIRLFPYEAVFYANRALCHLKMDNLFSAESDCTSAILRDEHYVKAYHRRATARMALKQYAEATEDLKKLLTLDRDNSEAKKMLATAQGAVNKSKSTISSITKTEEPVSKLEAGKKPEKPTITLKILDVHKSKCNADNLSNYVIRKSGLLQIKETEGTETSQYPDWLPNIEDVRKIQVINTLPHRRSKKPLASVHIVVSDLSEIPSGVVEKKAADQRKRKNELESSLRLNEERLKSASNPDVAELDLPPIPVTAVQFLTNWNRNKSCEFRYQYLKRIPAESVPNLFQDSMESNTFSEIVQILKTHFVPHGDAVLHYLHHLTEIKRFRMLIMFTSKPEKRDLQALFDYGRTKETKSEVEINGLRSKYEL